MTPRPRDVLVVLGISCFTLAVAAQGELPNPPAPQTSPYHSQRYGFTMDIPQGWAFQERPQSHGDEEKELFALGADIVLIATERPSGSVGEFNVNLTVAVRDIPETKKLRGSEDIAAFAANVLESLSSSKEASAVKTLQQKGLVGAQRQFRYVQSYEGKAVPLSAIVTALVSTRMGRCFLITATAPAASSKQYETLFRDAIESFDELE